MKKALSLLWEEEGGMRHQISTLQKRPIDTKEGGREEAAAEF